MNQATPTFQQETQSALQGGLRLLMGKRDAAQFFYFDRRGLVSSFIALVVTIGISLALSAFSHDSEMVVSSFNLLFTNVALYGVLTLVTFIVLTAFGKQDRFIPYLVVDNWLNAIMSFGLAFIGLMDTSGQITLFLALILGLIVRVNNARLIVELKIWQIVVLMLAQGVGVMLAMGTLTGILMPEMIPTA